MRKWVLAPGRVLCPWESALTRQAREELVIGWVSIFRKVVAGDVGEVVLSLGEAFAWNYKCGPGGVNELMFNKIAFLGRPGYQQGSVHVHYQSNYNSEPLEVECSQGGTPKVGYQGFWVKVHLAAPSCDLERKGVEGKEGFGQVAKSLQSGSPFSISGCPPGF